MRNALILNFCIFLVLSAAVFGQTSDQPQPSLGDVARQSRAAHKPDDPGKTKKVLDNEDLKKGGGPIPEVSLGQQDNTQEIVDAIFTYSKDHTPQETEAAIHQWYDGEVATVRAAFTHNITIGQDRASVTSANSVEQPNWENPDSYRQQMAANQQRDLSDLRTVGTNQLAISRIMGALRKVKNDLQMERRWTFEWFDTDGPNIYIIPMANRPGQYGPYRNY
jgi:hypothetical protein